MSGGWNKHAQLQLLDFSTYVLSAVYNYSTFFSFPAQVLTLHSTKARSFWFLRSVCCHCSWIARAVLAQRHLHTHTLFGTLVTIKQECLVCLSRSEWNSQPNLKQGPARNILLSASISFSGSLPTKVLRLLNIFGCATISRNTYYRYQEHLLQPCIYSVWSEHQSTVFKELCDEKRPLVCQNEAENIHIITYFLIFISFRH